MRCPGCGTEMNHHATKCVEPVDARETALVDPDLGGVIQEIHACPGCGNVEARIRPPAARVV